MERWKNNFSHVIFCILSLTVNFYVLPRSVPNVFHNFSLWNSREKQPTSSGITQSNDNRVNVANQQTRWKSFNIFFYLSLNFHRVSPSRFNSFLIMLKILSIIAYFLTTFRISTTKFIIVISSEKPQKFSQYIHQLWRWGVYRYEHSPTIIIIIVKLWAISCWLACRLSFVSDSILEIIHSMTGTHTARSMWNGRGKSFSHFTHFQSSAVLSFKLNRFSDLFHPRNFHPFPHIFTHSDWLLFSYSPELISTP